MQWVIVMPRTKSKEKMILISVHIPEQLLSEVDELVRRGMFPSRSEAIRAAIRSLLYGEDGYDMLITGR